MRKIYGIFLLLVFLLFAGIKFGVCDDPQSLIPALENNASTEVDPFKNEIPNIVILADDIWGGGKPTSTGFEMAKKMGVKTIIDLRTPIEGTQEEQKLIENLKMNYINIPVIPSSLDNYEVEQLRAVLVDPQSRPAIIHCSSGGRVLKLWTLYKSKYGEKNN